MLAEPRSDGRFAGIVPASVALARELNVSLVGLAQLGGRWLPELRRTDGMPWCGCLQGPDDDPADWSVACAFVGRQRPERQWLVRLEFPKQLLAGTWCQLELTDHRSLFVA